MQLLFFRVGSATGQRTRGTGMGSNLVLRLFCKNWSAVFLQFLDSTGLTTLSAKCKIAKLCFLYKTVNKLTSFPATIIRFRSSVPFHIRSCHAFLLTAPHARTGYFYYSFVYTVFARSDAAATIYFTAQFRAASIRERLLIESGVY